MISSRSLAALGLLAAGIYMLRRGVSVASGVPGVNGLGDDTQYTDENGNPITADQYNRMMAIQQKLTDAQAHIQTIKQLLVVIPDIPQFGPTKALAA